MNQLHTYTVSPEMLSLLSELMKDNEMHNFRLVGGTALSLLIGHRRSIDIDLFTDKDFNVLRVFEKLHDKYAYIQNNFSDTGTRGYIGTIKCDFFNHKHLWIDNPVVIDNIRMASVKEIAAMKIYAIIESNGKRLKDFVDIAFISEFLSLQQILSSFQEKYKGFTDTLALKAMFDFGNIDFTKPIELISNEFNWTGFEKRFELMLDNPNSVLPKLESKTIAYKQKRGRKL